MTDTDQFIEVLDARVKRREERRGMFKAVLGAAAVGAGALAFASAAEAQTVTDADILNFALNLEYLEAQFYSYALSGTGLAASLMTGTGTQGAVDMPAAGIIAGRPRAVDFTGEPVVAQYAREIAADEVAHVAFLRTALTSAAVSQPRINISGDETGAFTAAARAAGVVTPSGPGGTFLATDVFDPYASANNFLLGSFIFEDVGVTAYKGAAPLISLPAYVDAAAGILAVEAYHAAIIRTTLYSRGVATPALRTSADKISDARDSLDGTTDLDQGISPVTAGTTVTANIVPTDSNAIAFSRTTGQVLNIVYLNKAQVSLGGFFPAGVNGTIRTSAAN